MEIRSYSENAAPSLEGDRLINGYAMVFGQESRIMYEKETKRFFIEVIENGALTEETLQTCDVKALIEHNRQRLIARSVNGKGSLSLLVDDYGLKYRFESPATNDGDYAVIMVKRGDINGSSFAYTTNEKENVTYEKQGSIWLRRVHKIDRIFDVSIVSDPAYFGTEVTTRSFEDLQSVGTSEKTDYQIELNKLRRQI